MISQNQEVHTFVYRSMLGVEAIFIIPIGDSFTKQQAKAMELELAKGFINALGEVVVSQIAATADALANEQK